MLRSILLVALVSLHAPALQADRGEITIIPRLALAVPLEGRAGLGVDLGLSPQWAVRGDGMFAWGTDAGAAGLGSLGVVWALDVLTLVPEVFLGGGVRLDGAGVCPRALASVGLRYFFSFQWALAPVLGGEWSGGALGGFVGVDLRYVLGP